jgi:hypothetical protein
MENVEKEFISERQASLLLQVSNRTIKIWRDKGYFDDFKIVKNNTKRPSVFYFKEDILKWFTQYLGDKEVNLTAGKKLKNHKNS